MSELEIEDDPLQKIPANEDTNACGYFDDREETCILTCENWINSALEKELSSEYIFGNLLEKGFRRSGRYYYFQVCENCNECTPIRVPVNEFIPTKSQRVAWRKNQDLEIKIVDNPDLFATEEKAFMYREYDNYHNCGKKDYKKYTMDEAVEILRLMNADFKGVVNMEYRLNGKLIAVAILDITKDSAGEKNAISSNYFYYDIAEDVLKRSIGVFSVLKEIELCKEMNIPYYYLGLYLPNCRKMNYKINYKPYELLEKGRWIKYY